MTNQFTIERDIPAPTYCSRGGAIYPWRDMEIGDSFLGPDTESFRRAAHAWGARHKQIMTTRKVPGGVRVWRLS